MSKVNGSANGYRHFYDLLDNGLGVAEYRAAWAKAGKKPNGALEQEPLFWPRDVRTHLDEITKAVHKARRGLCDCKKKERKKNPVCAQAERRALRQLRTLHLPRGYAPALARYIGQLAHTKEPGDRSAE